MTVNQKKMKAYVSDMTLRIGPITTNGKLISAYATDSEKAASFKFCTPDGEAVKQKYVAEDGSVWNKSDLAFYQESDDGNISIFSQEQVNAAKASTLPKNVMNLTVHNADDVAGQLYPNKAAVSYVFYPHTNDPANVQWYDLLVNLLERDEKALVGFCNLQNYEGLFRLIVWRGRIILQKQTYPNELNPHEDYENAAPKEAVKKAISLLEKLTAPFDQDTYQNNVKAKLANLQSSDTNDHSTIVKSVTDSFDILSALENFEV
jgi:non-homologous end joining protein Ku